MIDNQVFAWEYAARALVYAAGAAGVIVLLVRNHLTKQYRRALVACLAFTSVGCVEQSARALIRFMGLEPEQFARILQDQALLGLVTLLTAALAWATVECFWAAWNWTPMLREEDDDGMAQSPQL